MWRILLIFLALFSYRDIRKKSLPVWWLAVGMMISVMFGIGKNMWSEDMSFLYSVLCVLIGMIPGMAFLLLAVVWKGKLGCGDGLVLMMVGAMTGLEDGLVIWASALACSFVCSCILLTICKKGKDYCFPFVPFYFLGALLVYMLTGGG